MNKYCTLQDFYKEYRKGMNLITGQQNLFKDITDQMIWDAAIEYMESVKKEEK
jgi:hypothetical protein